MIRIVTDSSSDLPVEVQQQHGITIVPLTIRFGSETFVDGVDLDTGAFWSRLGSSSTLPETAAPSAGAFMDTFDVLSSEGASGIVVLSLSARLSATHQSAVIAAENVASRIDVRVIDSGTVSMALGLAAMVAAEAARAGGDVEAVAAAALSAAARSEVIVALDTLEFLKRGGRIGGAQAMLGGMLDVKPLVTVDDGVVAAAGRVRTRSKARAAIVDRAAANAHSPKMAVLHGAAADSEEVLAEVREVVGDHVLVAELGPVVGTHAGPGAIGVAYVRG